jgi:hypothetical protein
MDEYQIAEPLMRPHEPHYGSPLKAGRQIGRLLNVLHQRG